MRSLSLFFALSSLGCLVADDPTVEIAESSSGGTGHTSDPGVDTSTSTGSTADATNVTDTVEGDDSSTTAADEGSTTGEPLDPCDPATDLVSPIDLHAVFPNETDPAMRDEPLPHLYAEPLGAPREQLLVFLPGTDPGYAQGMQTDGGPEAYTDFLRQAAGLGYHVIGLMYVNDIPVNVICPGNPPAVDCHERLREEIITGVDLHDAVSIPPADSIIHRLEQLLVHLGWEQYLDAEGSVLWEAVAVAGHSQGGGHAAFLGRMFEVDRVIMAASTEGARWTRRAQFPMMTPADRFYGISSELDAVFNGNTFGWANMQVPGPLTSVDDGNAPDNGAHQLTLSIDAADGNHHGTAVGDVSTPRTDDGTPLLRGVWCYLLANE